MSRAAAARRRISSLLDYLPITCRAGLVEWEIRGRARDLGEAFDSRVCRQEGRESACWCGKNMTRELRARIEAEPPLTVVSAAEDGLDPWATVGEASVGGGKPTPAGDGMWMWRMCRGCGCTQDAACFMSDQPCHWVEADLYSACAK